jgi:acyl-CoA dehydrogenase
MTTATAKLRTAQASPPILPSAGGFKPRVETVSAAAAAHADAVDRDARFPHEAIDAARSERLLSLLVPVELGGEGASVSDIVDICYALGRACGSSAMVFAMHQIMVAIWCATPATAPGISGCCGA